MRMSPYHLRSLACIPHRIPVLRSLASVSSEETLMTTPSDSGGRRSQCAASTCCSPATINSASHEPATPPDTARSDFDKEFSHASQNLAYRAGCHANPADSKRSRIAPNTGRVHASDPPYRGGSRDHRRPERQPELRRGGRNIGQNRRNRHSARDRRGRAGYRASRDIQQDRGGLGPERNLVPLECQRCLLWQGPGSVRKSAHRGSKQEYVCVSRSRRALARDSEDRAVLARQGARPSRVQPRFVRPKRQYARRPRTAYRTYGAS